MKIKTRLLLNAAFLLAIVMIIGLIVAVSNQKVNDVTQKEILAQVLVQKIFSLNALTDDYLLHHQERAKIQWEKNYQSIETILQQDTSEANSLKAYEDKITKDLYDSHDAFNQLIHTTTDNLVLRERLADTFQLNSQSMVHTATQLSLAAVAQRQAIRAFADQVVLTFIFIIALFVLISFFLTYRSLVTPIDNLTTVALKIQKGDLTKRARIFSQDELGTLAMSFNLMIDALKESHENLEKKIAERTQQLQESNKELEAFSYSVSHDLRAPLRAIDGFSKILEDDYAAKIDEAGQKVITTIRKSTKQMGNLIDDLLSLSRLGRKPLETENVDMTMMAKSVFDELKQANPHRKISFICEPLPLAHADPSLLRQVWINLLSNAIKYTQKKENTTIIVDSKTEKEKTTYFVKDNGAGFDMKYKDKLFGVFQRLHSAKEFEGTGVGLAIVARIIAKHRGQVQAEGKINEGATFSFSLPHTSPLASKTQNEYANMSNL